MNKKKYYDYIFIGTSIINMLEAIYQKQIDQNSKILLIDKQDNIGGAWKTLNIFKLKNVENAIHYFLHDRDGLFFMKNILKWDIKLSENKYRIFCFFGKFYIKINYSIWFGNLLHKIIEAICNNHSNILTSINSISKNLFRNRSSFYINGGAAEMIKNVKVMLNNLKVETKLKCNLNKVEINTNLKMVKLKTTNGYFFTKNLFISHGSRIPNFLIDKIKYKIKENFYPRPAFHLYVEDITKSKIYEGIFVNDPIIKYVHDVSRYTDDSKRILKKFKVFVFALQSDIKNSKDLKLILFNKIKLAGLISKKAKLLNHKWTNYILPTLHDKDLEMIKCKSEGTIKILYTENFCRGIGLNSKRWKPIFSKMNLKS